MESKQVQNVVTSENLAEFNLSRVRFPLEVQEPQANEEKEVDKAKESPKSGKNAVSVTEKVDSEGEHEEENEESTGHGKPRHKNGIQKRFSEITADRNEARRLAAESKAEADTLRKRIETLENAGKPASGDSKSGKPSPDSFKDPFEYAEALSDWKVTQKLQERDEADRKKKADAEATIRAKEWERRVKEVSKDIEDYDEVMAEADTPLTHELAVAILESDIGPRIQYYLAKNPDELEELKGMSIGKMLRMFGKLEAKLDAEDGKGKKEDDPKPVIKPAIVKRTVTVAPEPITPIKTAGSSAGNEFVDESTSGRPYTTSSIGAYRAARKAGKIK